MTERSTIDSTVGDDSSLPRVPVPDLPHSCERFLEWCEPLLTAAQLAGTRVAVERLLAPDSPAWALQEELVAYDARPDVGSWLDDFWSTRYLGRRDRIALNANFFFLFPNGEPAQTRRAAELALAALDYKLAIDGGTLPPPSAHGIPLSSEQNRYLFSATRIPGERIDSSRSPYTAGWPGASAARHVLVLRRGRMFRLDLLDADDTPYATDVVASALDALRDTEPAPHPLGHLTTMARADWARARDRLLTADARNADALDQVETALFCVCLDDDVPADVLAASDGLLHGATAGHGNRWYDKSLSFIVFADGTAGLNGEHCKLDGTTMVAMVEAMLDPGQRERIRTTTPSPGRPDPAREITFVLDDVLRSTVDRAGADFRAFADATASQVVHLDVGANAAKQRKASPDAVVQQAIQLAQHRARGRVGATYESIATRTFRNGRTEAMRVVTPESARFVDAMADGDDDTRRTALRAAIDAHVRRAKQCQAGDAPEQHLWELQLLAVRRGEPEPPALYESAGWQVMRTDQLSTSSVPSTFFESFGFGSTSTECIGVGYVLLADSLRVYLSTPRDVADGMRRFAAALPVALDDVLTLLTDATDDDR